jgi:hypothetical protein
LANFLDAFSGQKSPIIEEIDLEFEVELSGFKVYWYLMGIGLPFVEYLKISFLH